MRVLFTTFPAYGHFHPLVCLARALQQAGHEVAFATAASFRHAVEGAGFRHFAAGGDPATLMSGGDVKARTERTMRASAEDQQRLLADMFVGLFATRMVPDLLRVADEW